MPYINVRPSGLMLNASIFGEVAPIDATLWVSRDRRRRSVMYADPDADDTPKTRTRLFGSQARASQARSSDAGSRCTSLSDRPSMLRTISRLLPGTLPLIARANVFPSGLNAIARDTSVVVPTRRSSAALPVSGSRMLIRIPEESVVAKAIPFPSGENVTWSGKLGLG